MTSPTCEPGYELIDQFHAKFIQRTGLPEFPEFGKGHRAVSHNGTVPRIVFVDTGGSVSMDAQSNDSEEPDDGSGDGTGDAQGELAGDSQDWDVHLWAPDRESMIQLYHELLRSMRDVIGRNVQFRGDYDIAPTGEGSNGRKLLHRGLVLIRPVKKQTSYDFALIPVEHFVSTAGLVDTIPETPTYQTVQAAIGTPVTINQDEKIEE